MTQLARALSSEVLKLKRTIALWMVFIAPMVVVTLQFMMLWKRGERFTAGREIWPIMVNGSYSLWAVLMLPLFITLETALLAGIEHSQRSWKHLFALPVPRSTIYVAKVLVATAMIGASCVILALGSAAAGFALDGLLPKAIVGPVPWNDVLTGAAAMFLASWLLIALHSWVALRWPSFALASGVGMAMTVGTAMVANSARWWKFYPWAFPMHATLGNDNTPLALTLGAFGGIVIAVLGCWDVTRRDVL
jgi:lantibiotic transport system permease protein